MAVEAFLKPTEAKITIEKEVKPKPTVEELTKIEQPGKPVSALSIEENISSSGKKRRKRKIEKSEAEEIKGNSILIITEKPQAAQKIANSLGRPKKFFSQGVYYFEVKRGEKRILIASAVGHLFTLSQQEGQKGWPIFETKWVPSFQKKSATFTKKYFNLLKELIKQSSEIYIATDFDTEGEVIGWNILRFIFKKENAKRMKFSTLTSNELEKSFENPLNELAWGNAYAGETRHIVDWLYGINLSRALMESLKKNNTFKILSIGRVQGPALKMIVEREREIAEFKPVPYWSVFAIVQGIKLKHPKDIFEKEELEKFKELKEGLVKTRTSEKRIQPPHPFDLTTLQREAYRVYGFSPSTTLKIAQQLYLDGLISYPRTSSQKIPEEIEPKKILKKLEKYFPEAKNVTREKPIEGKKEDPAHPSIYPTGEIKKNIAGSEEKLYTLIVKRFIAVFSSDAVVLNKKISLDADGFEFIAQGLNIKEKGWTSFYPIKFDELDLPDLNGRVRIDEIKFEEKETQPPKRYTPASLISALEKKGLGTKTTRSMIVDILFERGYLEGTSIKATPLGMQLISALERYSPIIIDEELTRKLDEEMDLIQSSKENSLDKREKKVIEEAKENLLKIAKEFKPREIEIGKELIKGIEGLREIRNENNKLNTCPTCKKGILRIMYSKKSKKFFIACSAYPECKQTYSLPSNALIKKSDKICEGDNFPKLLAIRKGKRPFEFCFNPDCPIEKKRREQIEKKE